MKIKAHITAQQLVACEDSRLRAFIDRVQAAPATLPRPSAESDPSDPTDDDPCDINDDYMQAIYPPRPTLQIDESRGLAIISVIGVITKGLSVFEQRYFGCADIDSISAMIGQVASNEKVKTVLILFNTPGGYLIGLEELAEKISELSAQKNTIGYTDCLCASAGYLLAVSCGRLYAAPSSMLGSIGVKVTYVDYSGMYDQAGIKVQVFASGQYKGMGTPGTSLTQSQADFIQAGIDREADKFQSAVQSNRPGVGAEAMQGQCFSGSEALALGLIDGLVPDLDSMLALI